MNGTAFFRSLYKGYAWKETPGGNRFVYTGDIRALDAPPRRARAMKWAQLTLALAAVGMFALGALRSVPQPYRLLELPSFLLAILTVFRLFAAAIRCIAPAEMTAWDYQYGVTRLRLCAFWSAVCSALLLAIGAAILLRGDWGRSALPGVLLHIPECAAALAAWVLEKRAHYTLRPGEKQEEDDEHV